MKSVALLDVAVDAVDGGVPERARAGLSAEEVVPEVARDALGVLERVQPVAAIAATDREEDLDAGSLAGPDTVAHAGTAPGGRVAMPSEVENRGPALAKLTEKANNDVLVPSDGAGLCEGSLVALVSLPPVYSYFAAIRGSGEEERLPGFGAE